LFTATVLAVAASPILSDSALGAEHPKPPAKCSSGDGKEGFNKGYATQEKLVRNLFATQYSCGSLEKFRDKMQSIFFPEPGTPDIYLVCVNEGRRAAIPVVLDAIYKECTSFSSVTGPALDVPAVSTTAVAGECAEEGRAAGWSAGEMFCNEAEGK